MSKTLCLLPLIFVACAGPDEEGAALTADEMVALRSSITALEPVREELPVEDAEIEELGVGFVQDSIAESVCEREGIVSGVWYEVAQSRLEGSWFRHGTGDLGGSVGGTYGAQGFEGDATGDGVDVALTGSYGDGLFVGDWSGTDAEGVARAGELIGRYERRNDIGGYFFGVWSRCE